VKVVLRKGNLDPLVEERRANREVHGARDALPVPRIRDPDVELEVQRRLPEANEAHAGRWVREHVGTPPGDFKEKALHVLDIRSVRDADGQAEA
jgi:hypothetical protein